MTAAVIAHPARRPDHRDPTGETARRGHPGVTWRFGEGLPVSQPAPRDGTFPP